MMNRFTMSACLVLLLTIQSWAIREVRYNQAGYFPDKNKRVIIVADDNCQNFAWRIKNSNNQTVLNGQVPASSVGTGTYTAKAFNHIIDFSSLTQTGTYSFEIDGVSTFTVKVSTNPYAGIDQKILRMFRVRRSGSNDCLDHAPSHFGDASSLIYRRQTTTGAGAVINEEANWRPDAGQKKVNMLGGWYDAGDYIKFTHTIAYSAYFLLHSYQSNTAYWQQSNLYTKTSFNDMLDETKHGLDFLVRTMPDANEFIIQTGGADDHKQWPMRLPENDALDGQRECYSAFSKTQMGLTAAALAIGASVFQAEGHTALATTYRNKAIEIYNAARNSNQPTAWWQGGHELFYSDNSDSDNMQLAATELYKLTGNNTYLNQANSYATTTGNTSWASWANLNLIAHARLYPDNNNVSSYLTTSLNTFRNISNQTGNIWKVPHNTTWGSLWSYLAVAHGALDYQDATNQTTYEQMALQVLDFMMGINPWGICFVAIEDYPNAISSSYAAIYRLQPNLFPIGEVASGPTSASTHAAQSPFFSPAHNPNLPQAAFNTSNLTFFEQPGDYVCMETIITGLADAIHLLNMAQKLFAEDVVVCPTLSLEENYEICESDQITINTNVANTGHTFEWRKDNTIIPSAISSSYTATSVGTYSVTVTKEGCSDVTAQTIVTSLLPEVTPVSGCSGEQVILEANSPLSLSWYEQENGGNSIGEGNQLEITITETKTYYVQSGSSVNAFTGKTNQDASGGWFNSTNDYWLVFDAFEAFIMKSAKIYSSGTQSSAISILNSQDAVIASKTLNLINGEQRVSLDFDIPAGTNYRIAVSYTGNGIRLDESASYPYTISGVISIKGYIADWALSTVATNWYTNLYDIEITQGRACKRVPVTATLETCTGSVNSNEQVLTVFPNPFANEINLNHSGELTIRNVAGESVYDNPNYKGEKIQLNELENGLYIIEIISIDTQKGILRTKIVKK